MSLVTINTHRAFKMLVESGVPEEQAEGHIKVLEEIDVSGMATKNDLNRLEYRLKIWVIGGFLTQFVALTALIFQFFK